MRGFVLWWSLILPTVVLAFTPALHTSVRPLQGVSLMAKKRVLVAERPSVDEGITQSFDPFNFEADECHDSASARRTALSLATAAVPLTSLAGTAAAVTKDLVSSGDLNPDNFNPICPASDGVYRTLQGTTQAIVGDEAFIEYRPLIAGGLLRIRLELCVVESFFNEAVGPFIEKNGFGWILPLHETVETFLAGSVFSLASTFILVGSTKIVSVLVTYVDLFVGLPSRVFGGFFFDRARGKPVTLDLGFGPFKRRVVGPPDTDEEQPFIQDANPFSFAIAAGAGAVKLFGETSRVSHDSRRAASARLVRLAYTDTCIHLTRVLQVIKEFVEGVDLFVGRYLVFLATLYIGIKFLHFRVFPDFPNF
jgi:hypothetical protein